MAYAVARCSLKAALLDWRYHDIRVALSDASRPGSLRIHAAAARPAAAASTKRGVLTDSPLHTRRFAPGTNNNLTGV
ncbi:hypothetical protein [Burkholderia territorii]|uniref:hypothetical protein n=1 Tax=Burkholderia territorii TaxID=1503055 RepID=UPI000AAC6443|nr:hypothetical protein [Burkholderia territorii]